MCFWIKFWHKIGPHLTIKVPRVQYFAETFCCAILYGKGLMWGIFTIIGPNLAGELAPL